MSEMEENLPSNPVEKEPLNSSKPIKKKTPAFDFVEDNDSSEGSAPHGSPNVPSRKDAEDRARKDLVSFLTSKGIEQKSGEQYQVHIKFTRPRKNGSDANRKSDSNKYSVTYTGPEGSILTSKADVLNSILHGRRRHSNPGSSIGNSSQIRIQAHETAKEKVSSIIFPADVDGFLVTSLGKIHESSDFNSVVQIYPVGYKSQQNVPGNSASKGKELQTVCCEISELDGFPEFKITVPDTGDAYLASSEAAVWKKYLPNYQDTEWQFSFFNLEIELLIEGLEGALQCSNYKFHVERGYGDTYHTQSESMSARAAFLFKIGRERRNQDRQNRRFLSKEEQQQQLESQSKKMAEEKEVSRKMAQLEKERKDRAREEAKRLKEEKRKEETKKKESLKQQELKRKEREKEQTKLQKEKNKKNDKFRQQIRKEVTTEMKKNRIEANSAVLQFFDDEELEIEERAEQFKNLIEDSKIKDSTFITKFDNLDEFLSHTTKCEDIFPTSTSTSDSRDKLMSYMGMKGFLVDGATWDDVFQFCCTLHLYKFHLNLEIPLDLDHMINSLKAVCLPPTPDLNSTQNNSGNNSMKELSSSMEVTNEVVKVEGKEEIKGGNKDMDEEVEWDEAVLKKEKIDETKLLELNKIVQAEAEIDKIQLKIVKSFLSDLSFMLDLDEKDSTEVGKNQGKNQEKQGFKIRFPLNQLTWPELARMSIITHIYVEMGKDKETIQNALRGSKQPYYRNTKNIARNIRYRMATRYQAEFAGKKTFSSPATNSFLGSLIKPQDWLAMMARKYDTAETSNINDRKRPPHEYESVENLFTSEQEIVSSLTSCLTDPLYSDNYRRCCKVMLRILSMNQVKNLLWEIDGEGYPEYYEVILRPGMIARVASKLVNKAYNVKNSDEEDPFMPLTFYEDLMQVAYNCLTYNSEFTPYVAQAQKVLQSIYRHVDCWINDRDRPLSLDDCDEQHCLLTLEPIPHHNTGSGGSVTLRCGRCSGVYHSEMVHQWLTNPLLSSDSGRRERVVESLKDFYVIPTQEVLSQYTEEWVCPLCLREDSTTLLLASPVAAVESNERNGLNASVRDCRGAPFYCNEWGPSTFVPWVLNTEHSSVSEEFFLKDAPFLKPLFQALAILSNSNISSLVSPHASLALHLQKTSNSSDSTLPTLGLKDGTRCWSIAERTVVLSALCLVFRGTDRGIEVMHRIYADCEKLLKISNKSTFREADFMQVVKVVAGDEGVSRCRMLLDGIDSPSDAYLHNQIVEGRCVVCNGSTFDEDMEGGDADGDEGVVDEVILCDGCNAEVHLKCLNMSTVPTEEWHCNACKERIAQREASHGKETKLDFESAEAPRNRVLEDDLFHQSIMSRIAAEDDSLLPSSAAGTSSALKALKEFEGWQCVYCGQGQSEICSPFVVGQSRAEHDEQINACRSLTTDNFFPVQTGTKVAFTTEGREIEGPTLDFPYFPLLSSPEGKQLLKAQESVLGENSALVAHQICALQLFQARVNRSRHSLRRRRKAVGKLAGALAGASLQPLGKDRRGREYWRLPCSDALFICEYSETPIESGEGGKRNPEKDQFNALIKHEKLGLNESSMDVEEIKLDLVGKINWKKTWKRVDDFAEICKIVEFLGDCSSEHQLCEQRLRREIINSLLLEKKTTVTAATQQDTTKTDDNDMDVEKEETPEEKSPSPKESPVDNSDQEPSEREKRRVPPQKTVPVVDNEAVGLKLVEQKGQEIPKLIVIPRERVFEEDLEPDSDDEGMEQQEIKPSEYLTFSKGRKYYAIGLVNQSGNLIKVAQHGVSKWKGLSVVYQIQREGLAQPLTYAPLSEPWTDHMYYFSTVTFRRSGRYKISFFAEGNNAGAMKPLIFPVQVEAKTVRCGVLDALDRLTAVNYNDASGRQVITGRKELLRTLETVDTELDAVRSALLSVYLALPMGALTGEASVFGAEEKLASARMTPDVMFMVTEPDGWNPVLDQCWRKAVLDASCPLALMECVLLLEFYLQKAWLGPGSKLLSALPAPHFAVRCSSYSAVALRVYCLDRCLLYEKIYNPPRSRRGDIVPTTTQPRSGTTSGRSSSRRGSREDYEELDLPGRGSSRRGAAAAASQRIKSQSSALEEGESPRKQRRSSGGGDSEGSENYEDEDDEEEDDDDVDDEEDGDGEDGPKGWKCTECTVVNEPRSRSCATCGERKPSIQILEKRDRGRSTRGRQQKRQKKRKRYSDEDDEGEDGGYSNRRSGRSRRSVSYQDYEEEEEEPRGTRRSRRGADEDSAEKAEERKKRRAMVDSDEEELNYFDTDPPFDEYMRRYRKALPGRISKFGDYIAQVYQRSEATKDEVGLDHTIRQLSILRKLLSNEMTEPFWLPVDLKANPTYKDVVEEPMDLLTITSKVRGGAYKGQNDPFLKDVRLVWDNCKAFNPDFTELHHLAIKLSNEFEDLVEKWITSSSRPTNPDIAN